MEPALDPLAPPTLVQELGFEPDALQALRVAAHKKLDQMCHNVAVELHQNPENMEEYKKKRLWHPRPNQMKICLNGEKVLRDSMRAADINSVRSQAGALREIWHDVVLIGFLEAQRKVK